MSNSDPQINSLQTNAGQHGGLVVSTVASQQEGPVGFSQKLWFPPTIKHMYVRVNTPGKYLELVPRRCAAAAHCC